MIISFAWTTPALLAGRKIVTRRHWPAHYARRFKADSIVQAWSKSPRYQGMHVADIRLIDKPYEENTAQIPASDWEGEGFAYLESIGASVNGSTPREIWDDWLLKPKMLYVVRFELVRIVRPEFPIQTRKHADHHPA